MFDKFTRSWSLVKASAAVLRADKELLWFPVISSIAAMLVAATFLVPSFLSGLFDGGAGAASVVAGFLFYVTQFTDDEINDVTVRPGGFRLEKIALGPQLIYYFSPKAGICG